MAQTYQTSNTSASVVPGEREGDLLVVRDLRVHRPVKGGLFGRTVAHARAIDGISFSVRPGEALTLVGEAGVGKSTLARALARLLPVESGAIAFDGADALAAQGPALQTLRRDLQLLWGDHDAGLDPRMPIGVSVAEGMEIHGIGGADEQRRRVRAALSRVGIAPALSDRRPHELTAGQRQRAGIARALVMEPKLIVADNPAGGLDAPEQAQVLRLLREIQQEFGLSILLLADSMSHAAQLGDRVGVLYLGDLAELAPRDELFRNPLHPYTKALLSAMPLLDPTTRRDRINLVGDMPSAVDPPSGCTFHTRCWRAEQVCRTDVPRFVEHTPGHWAACHFAGDA
jgi:oligopeptide transport system ATP-binding protein